MSKASLALRPEVAESVNHLVSTFLSNAHNEKTEHGWPHGITPAVATGIRIGKFKLKDCQ